MVIWLQEKGNGCSYLKKGERMLSSEEAVKTKMLKTTNRNLEAYLYKIGFSPKQSCVLWDGMVQWSYEDSAELREAVLFYRRSRMRVFKGQKTVITQ